MKQENGEIVFNKSEFTLSGLWTIPLAGVADAIANLHARSTDLTEASFNIGPLNGDHGEGYALFQRANDMRLLADKLVEFMPPTENDEFDSFLDSLQA